MAILPDADRVRIWRGLMRYWSDFREPIVGMVKQDLRDAVDATDDWIDANQTSYNAALPVTFRTNATQSQKTILFCSVALMRVSAAFLKKVFGVVD